MSELTDKANRPSRRAQPPWKLSQASHGSAIIPYGNGLVEGITRASNQDMHLGLRLDDIWLGILTQFNFFVNGKDEILRPQFVTHEGQKCPTWTSSLSASSM